MDATAIEVPGRAIEGARWTAEEAERKWAGCFNRKSQADVQLQASRREIAVECAKCWDLGGGKSLKQVANGLRVSERQAQRVILWGRVLWHHNRLGASAKGATPGSPMEAPRYVQQAGKLPPAPPRPGYVDGPTEHQTRELAPVAHDPDLVAQVLRDAQIAAEADADRRATRAKLAGFNTEPVVTVTRRNVREAVAAYVPPTQPDQAAEYQANVKRLVGHLEAAEKILDVLDEGAICNRLQAVTADVRGLAP
jgi:hypothetical protein